MAKMAAAAEGGSGPTAEEQAALSSLQGQYPVSDAGILAAIYVAAYEKDAGPLKLARETLTKVSPSEVRRVAKGEPRWVRKQAESLRR